MATRTTRRARKSAEPVDVPVQELTDRELRERLERGIAVLNEVESSDPADMVRRGRADHVLARGEAALVQVEEASAELRAREDRSLIERLPRMKMMRDAERREHPALRWLEAAKRYSAPEMQGERLVADRLTEDDAAQLKQLVQRRRALVDDPDASPLSEAETAAWERLLGRAAGDEELFERKRRDAAARAKLGELMDQRKVASLPRRPLLAEPGSVQLPRHAFTWLVGESGRDGHWTLMDVALLVGILGAFANDEPSIFVGGRFGGEQDDRTLVVPGGIGSTLRLHGRIAGDPFDEAGHIRIRPALATLARNRWIEVERSTAELRIRLGDRAREIQGHGGGNGHSG
jgi:hypothetical protein